jgi:hypothetical protein
MHTGFWCESLPERDHLENMDISCKAILKLISKKDVDRGWNGLIWLRIVKSGGLLWMQ